MCWPDELQDVTTQIQAAETIKLDLLERGELDQLLVSMGVTGRLARSEILSQAEGRPGWAVALGDLLLRSRDPGSLLSGKALLGQVQRYLQRASIPTEATDLLATVAAIGHVTEAEIGELAAELGMSRPKITGLLASTAKSGIVDVESQYDQTEKRHIRHYSVRPPMLADVIVADRAFAADVPGVDLRSLTRRWPAKSAAVAESAIDSALLGARGARTEAEHFYHEVVRSAAMPQPTRVQLVHRFAQIDRDAAIAVHPDIRAAFEDWKAAGPSSPQHLEPLIELSYLIAGRYLIDDAVELLLDAALVDQRPTNPNPRHPMRKLTDLVHGFHPELPPPRDQRRLVARVAERWIEQDRSNERWMVYGSAVEDVLSLHLMSALTAPGDPRIFQLIETVEVADEIRSIHEDMWPPIRRRLKEAPPQVIKTVIQAVQDWLRVGFDRPVGHSPPQSSIDTARQLGENMLRDLVPLTAHHPGLATQLQQTCDQFGIEQIVPVNDSFGAFLVGIDLSEDWEAAIQQLQEGIGEVVQSWATEEPLTVVPRLVDLRTEIALSNIHWPDRVEMACRALASRASDPLSWADLALEHGLFPEASPFLRQAVDEAAELGEERLARYLSVPSARWAVISVVLLAGTSAVDRQQIIASLEPGDYGVLETLYFRQQLSPEISRDLLTEPSPAARGAVAAAMFAPGRPTPNDWSPGELEHEWLDAIELFDPAATWRHQDWEVAHLATFLATHYPDHLVRWVRARMEAGLVAEHLYAALPYPAWESLQHLPIEQKDELWLHFSEKPVAQWLLGYHFVGESISWLEHALDRKLISADKALTTYNSLGSHPSVEQLARLLVPRGVDPRDVACMAESGMWTGERSGHYTQLVKQFQRLAESDEEAVAAVGRVGVEAFAAARDEALERERRKRIRGEL